MDTATEQEQLQIEVLFPRETGEVRLNKNTRLARTTETTEIIFRCADTALARRTAEVECYVVSADGQRQSHIGSAKPRQFSCCMLRIPTAVSNQAWFKNAKPEDLQVRFQRIPSIDYSEADAVGKQRCSDSEDDKPLLPAGRREGDESELGNLTRVETQSLCLRLAQQMAKLEIQQALHKNNSPNSRHLSHVIRTLARQEFHALMRSWPYRQQMQQQQTAAQQPVAPSQMVQQQQQTAQSRLQPFSPGPAPVYAQQSYGIANEFDGAVNAAPFVPGTPFRPSAVDVSYSADGNSIQSVAIRADPPQPHQQPQAQYWYPSEEYGRQSSFAYHPQEFVPNAYQFVNPVQQQQQLPSYQPAHRIPVPNRYSTASVHDRDMPPAVRSGGASPRSGIVSPTTEAQPRLSRRQRRRQRKQRADVTAANSFIAESSSAPPPTTFVDSASGTPSSVVASTSSEAQTPPDVVPSKPKTPPEK